MTIDTSRMTEGKRAALELAESARDVLDTHQSIASGLFMGRFPWDQMYPYPEQSAADRTKGESFLSRLETVLRDQVDADEIDQTGEIPQSAVDALASIGAFGIKIPEEYGGLGLSQINYSRAAMLLGSHCGNTTALVSAHQSIGVPQPILLFGTDEQKRTYLPRVARGEISAFALTEYGVGSDPARMETRADPSPDGAHYVINGEKLWCTNGTRAGVIVVMARTPPKIVDGKERSQITAFIVDMDTPGVTIENRCHFMGLRALYNARIRFENVRVPRENVLVEEGKGLKVALTTLNTGRMTLPAACVGLGKRCLAVTRQWANERVQWGSPIGHHAAIADKIARMASTVYAMEAMTLFTSAHVDRGDMDIRVDAAMCKMWCTERAWEIVDETMQIRGGRGYETATSLQARGEPPIPVERYMRDCRINMIFEGSSEIMRLFIAREALDPHLKIGGALVMGGDKRQALGRAARFYPPWYLSLWRPWPGVERVRMHPVTARHARYAARASRRLARALFHAMLRHGPKLEREQLTLGRLVDIGTELFAIATTCSRAQSQLDRGEQADDLIPLVDYFCRESRLRIRRHCQSLACNNDRRGYRLARAVLDDRYRWLEDSIVRYS